jgi:hypothetical protein
MKRIFFTLGVLLGGLGAVSASAPGGAPAEFVFTLESRSAYGGTNKCGFTDEEYLGTNCCSPVVHYYRKMDIAVTWDCAWTNGPANSGAAQYQQHFGITNGCEEVCLGNSGRFDIYGDYINFGGDYDCGGWSIAPGIDHFLCHGVETKTYTDTIQSCRGFDDWDFAGFYSRDCLFGGGWHN